MPQDVDRGQVFKTTRVRTLLKNDGSWIQKSQQDEEEQDKMHNTEQMVHAEETKPALESQKSYVLLTAKKFESQAPTHEITEDGEAQIENITAENKEKCVDIPVTQSNTNDSERAAEVDANAHVVEQVQNGEAQNVLSTKETPEEVSPMEPSEEQDATTPAEQSNTEHSEAQVSAIADADVPVAETSNVPGTDGSEDNEEVPAVIVVEVKLHEEPAIKMQNAADLKDAGAESTEPPAEESVNKCPPEYSTGEMFKAEAVVLEESLPDLTDVIHPAQGEELALQNSKEADLPVESVSKPPTHCAAEMATEETHDNCPLEQSTKEEAVAEVVVESSPETSAVNDTETSDEAPLQGPVEPILDAVSKSPTQSAAETAVKALESKVESIAPTEPESRAEEVAECESQPVNDAVVEQNSADHVMELSITDALVPSPETTPDEVCDRTIKLTDALDVEPPKAEGVPEPVEDMQQSNAQKPEVSQPEETNTTVMSQKPREEKPPTHTLKKTRDGKDVCSFCDQTLGNTKIIFSEPLVICHPDCLKCGVCAMILGDLLTPMFLHDQVIHCHSCFAEATES
ncbi:fibrous sheath CABYR-binding protein [Echeneis naucrates]|uniref:fibrous sheath CABYR-binding protein n=1 Tax=Echeneis naucrates TaxID=173247 RepID=UPI001113C689|nr:fibrous sheath CABYR-binding protein-like [Echeneis naucrates]